MTAEQIKREVRMYARISDRKRLAAETMLAYDAEVAYKSNFT